MSELYYATVGVATGATDGPYHQKEQAFLDANDLSRYVPSLHFSQDPPLGLFYFNLIPYPVSCSRRCRVSASNRPLEVVTSMNLLYHHFPTMLPSYPYLRPKSRQRRPSSRMQSPRRAMSLRKLPLDPGEMLASLPQLPSWRTLSVW